MSYFSQLLQETEVDGWTIIIIVVDIIVAVTVVILFIIRITAMTLSHPMPSTTFEYSCLDGRNIDHSLCDGCVTWQMVCLFESFLIDDKELGNERLINQAFPSRITNDSYVTHQKWEVVDRKNTLYTEPPKSECLKRLGLDRTC